MEFNVLVGSVLALLLYSQLLELCLCDTFYANERRPGRQRRSVSYVGFLPSSNASYIYRRDVLLEDEAASEPNVQEKLVVRGQVVIMECLERDLSQGPFRPFLRDTHADAAVRWFRENNEVSPDLRVTWSVTGRLRISHVISADSGIWRCRKDGYFRRPLRLIVTIPPERPFLLYGGAKLAEGARLTTRTKNTLSVHCVVGGGNPEPTIKWFLNENEVTRNSTVRTDWKGSKDLFATISNVTISTVQKQHHNASLVCRVTHPALSRPHTAHLKLNIEYPPDFRLRRWPVWGVPLRERNSVAFLCLVDANPPSTPFWVKESRGEEIEVVSSTGWMNLTSVRASDRGWYKCSTSHQFGQFASPSVYVNVLESKSNGSERVGASRLDGNPQQSPGFILPDAARSEKPWDAEGSPCTPVAGSPSLCWLENESKKFVKEKGRGSAGFRNSPPGFETPPSECPPSAPEDTSSNFIWPSDMKIKVMNGTFFAAEGGRVMLTAHICGRASSGSREGAWGGPEDVTWLSPSRQFSISAGAARGRWTAFNLTSADSQNCVQAKLHIAPVSPISDEGRWIVLATGHSSSVSAAVLRLNVTTKAQSLAAAASDQVSHASFGAYAPALWFSIVIPMTFTVLDERLLIF